MKTAALRLALLLALVCLCASVAFPAHAEPFRPGQTLDQEQVAQVTATALAFMAPRILDPVPLGQLSMWGLRGLTTLDPRLSPTLEDGALRLVLAAGDGPRLVLQRPAPADDDAAAWGQAAAQMIRAGWNASLPVRRAGTGGVVRTFFDELLNHLDPYSRYVPPDAAAAAETERASAPATVQASRDGAVLVLRITGFADDTGAVLSRLITRAANATGRSRLRGLVLDLRGNRGGVLSQAAAAAQTLLTAGIEATTAGRDPQSMHLFQADGDDLSHGLPVGVLVDGRSASASEILAAALADRGRAVVIGSVTLGKGLVQTILNLPDGGALYLTWSRVIAPLGWPIQGLGVLPQVCTSFGEAALHRQLAALQAGSQPMQSALARERSARAPVSPEQALDIRMACPAAIGRDLDLQAAMFLLAHPTAYATALLRTNATDTASLR